MAPGEDFIVTIIKKYIEELEKNQVSISEAILFGSYAKGITKPESDIDVALISDSFTGDRFEDRRRIIPFRRKIDNRIEPIPFKTEDYYNGGMLAEEIKKTGKVIWKRP
jgi:predicted nucleotidyltransferase